MLRLNILVNIFFSNVRKQPMLFSVVTSFKTNYLVKVRQSSRIL